MPDTTVRGTVRERYAGAATAVSGGASCCDALATQVEGKVHSGFVRASKPASGSCCAPTCCLA